MSVIVPAFNAERFIGDALDSALGQTWQDLEVIVVDDGSTDGTAEIVRRYAERDERVRLIQQSNRGLSASRNVGIEESRGAFIALLDADDIWLPTKLEKQVACMTVAPPQVGVVYAWAAYLDQDGVPTGGYLAHVEEGDVFLNLIAYLTVLPSSQFIRREALDVCGLYSLAHRSAEDQEMNLRLAERYQYRVVPEVLLGYRLHPNSVSHDHRLSESQFKSLVAEWRHQYPQVPARVFRWHAGTFYGFLAARTLRRGTLGSALSYFAVAFRNDPTTLWRAAALFLKRAGMRLRRMRHHVPASGSPMPLADTVAALAAMAPKRVSPTTHPLGPFWRRRLAYIRSHQDRRNATPSIKDGVSTAGFQQ